MAKTKISEFSSTPANNTDIDSINIAEGCAPSNINDAIRELMAQLKDFQTGAVGDSFNGPIGSSTASTGAFTNITASGTLGVTGVATLGAGAILNTPASVTLTNATGLPISTGVSGLGTGVATALAVNVGSAGAPVVNGGALGTPSSGTVTNLTGTASININGTVGATTPTTGAFTTTTVSTSETLSYGTANGVTYLNGSKVLTSGSALTFDGNALSVLTSNANPLQVSSSNASATLVQHTNSNASADLFYRFRQNAGAGNFYDLTMEGSTNAFTIDYNDNERLRIDSSGNLGIGTSSPSYKVEAIGSSPAFFGESSTNGTQVGYRATIPSNSTNCFVGWVPETVAGFNGDLALCPRTSGNGKILFFTGSTTPSERMRLDSAGNLGLGVTPSAWFSVYKPMQLGSYGAAIAGQTNAQSLSLWNNAYPNASNVDTYTTTNAANKFRMDGGAFQFYTAPSGTAGDAISFTQAATLTADGDFLVGTTSAGGGANVKGVTLNNAGQIAVERDGGIAGVFNRFTSDGAIIIFRRSATQVGSIDVTTTATSYVTSSDQRLKTNIVDAPEGNIDAIKIRSFDWIADGSHQTYGVVAQELLEVAPYAVSKQNDPQEMMGVDYSKLVPMLIKEVQALRQRVATLEAQ